MTIEADPSVLDAAAAIVDGRAVDWNALASHADPDMVACLRNIASLAGSPKCERPLPTIGLPGRWGHLWLEEEIGRGAGGVVYRALDPVLCRKVALKLCPIDQQRGAALLTEAQAMARIEHPGVLKVHGAAELDGRVGFWSDLIDGETLAQLASTENRLGAAEVCALGLELCAALAAIHAVGLVHGDVKAQNIVRRRDGRHVLIDFGSSATANLESPCSGTPLYLPPERLGGTPATSSDDLYSLGVLLFRLFCGRFPVEAQSLDELIGKHREGTRHRLLDLRPDASSALIAAIERAIGPQVDARFRRASDFAVALQEALVAAAPGAGKAIARRRGKLIALVAAVCVLMLSALTVLHGPPDFSSPLAASFQARLLKSGSSGDSALNDGDRLVFGDTLSLEIELSKRSYVYVIDEDAQGRVFQMFPLADAALQNPLPPARRLRLPGTLGDRRFDWQVSSRGGRERIYVVVSDRPIPDLDPQHGMLMQVSRAGPIDPGTQLDSQSSPERGISGLSEPRARAMTGWAFGAWLDKQHSGDKEFAVRRFEFDNP